MNKESRKPGTFLVCGFFSPRYVRRSAQSAESYCDQAITSGTPISFAISTFS